jgi:hypothetical protein
MRASVSGYFSNLWTSFLAEIQPILDWFTTLGTKMYELGANIIQGLMMGITNSINVLKTGVKGTADTIISGIRNFLGIHSPSRVMMEIGVMTTEGLAVGLEESQGRVQGVTQDLAETVLTPFSHTSYGSSPGAPFDPTSGAPAQTLPTPAWSPAQASPAAASFTGTHGSSAPFSPIINITMNGSESPSVAQDVAERVKLAIQEVFESASRRQGIAGG